MRGIKYPAIDIALLGIDGIGKSTIAKELCTVLRQQGRAAEIISWKSASLRSTSGFTRDTLGDLYVSVLRMLFAKADAVSGMDLRDLFVSSSNENILTDIENVLGQAKIRSNSSSMIMGASMIEMAGNLVLKLVEIDRLKSEGCIVIQETFGYKHVVKEMFISKAIASQTSKDTEAVCAHLLEASKLMFSCLVKPDIGVYIHGDPELAYRWRLSQSGQVGIIEDLGLASDYRKESFIQLQRFCNEQFSAFAASNDWIQVEMLDRTKDGNIREALKKITDAIVEYESFK